METLVSGSLLCVTFLQVPQLGLALVSFSKLNLLCICWWDSCGLTDFVQIFCRELGTQRKCFMICFLL